MAGIILSIEVDDKGSVKVKQFSDETKKAFAEMKKGPEEATGSLNSLRDSWGRLAAGAGIAAGAFYAFKRMVFDMAPAMASAGNEIERMARNLNMSTDDFQKWSYVANMADVDVQGLGMTFQFLTRSMSEALQGSGDANKAFTALGINLKDTTRKTKDQQTVLLETIDALGKYAEGANRDALMMNVFGRSWMSVKPLIDQGTAAIKANMTEAERLSLILGKDVVKSLSESEESFKQFSMTFKVARIEIFEPFVKDLRNLIEELLGLRRAWKEGGIGEVWKELYAQSEKYKIEALTAPAWTKEWVAGWTPPKIRKPEAPELESTKIRDDIQKTTLAYHMLVAEADKLSEAGKMLSWEDSLWSFPARTLPDINALNLEFNMLLANAEQLSAAGTMPDWRESLEVIPSGFAEIEGHFYRLKDIVESFDTEAPQWIKDWVSNWKTGPEQMQEAWKTLGKNISSAWNFNVTGILRGTEKIGDAFKNMVAGMADAFTSAVSKMIMQWFLFGSITGEKKAGGGALYGGSWGGLIGSIAGLFHQEGGIFNQPTLGVIGDVPEAVIPLKDGKIPIEGRGGDICVINYNQVTDPNTFVRIYGPVVKKLSETSIIEAKKIGTPWTRE